MTGPCLLRPIDLPAAPASLHNLPESWDNETDSHFLIVAGSCTVYSPPAVLQGPPEAFAARCPLAPAPRLQSRPPVPVRNHSPDNTQPKTPLPSPCALGAPARQHSPVHEYD